MGSLASTLIKTNLDTKNPILDLGRCGLIGDEPELQLLRKCRHLKMLVMANHWYDYESPKGWWSRSDSINRGTPNNISQIGDYFPTGLKALILSNNKIKDISALSNLVELKVLILDYNLISDVSPLSKLNKLERLCLNNNQLCNVSSLAYIKEIKELYLGYNQIEDISILSSLSQLRILYLRYNKIFGLPKLGGLKSLKDLHLGNNPISELDPLCDLTQLEILQFEDYQLSDLTPISNLLQLKILVLNRNKIVDISVLKNLQQLVSLDLMVNQLSDLKQISIFRQLRYLNMSSNEVTDLRPLSSLSQLQYLRLRHNNITGLSALSNLINLRTLNVEYNTIKDLSPIGSLIHLEKLILNNNCVTDIDPLKRLVKLKELDLSYNEIQDISALENLSQIKMLKLSNNKISSFGSLHRLQSIKEIDVSFNYQSDLSILAHLNGVEKVKSSNNGIVNLAPFGEMDQLKELDVSNNKINDLSHLFKLNQLEKLILSGNELRDLKSLPSLGGLVELNLSNNLISDLSSNFEFDTLEVLDLSNNQIVCLQHLVKFIHLKELNLNNNRINNIFGLEVFVKLEKLYLRENQLYDFKLSVSLPNLKELDLSKNRINDVSGFPYVFNLEKLNLGNNRVSDFSSMCCLTRLKELDVYSNNIKDVLSIPDILNLERLNLSVNKITFISKEEFDRFHNLKKLCFNNNPIQNIPKEIVSSNENVLPSMRNFFHDMESGSEQNNEVKVIFIGNGSVGKTELARRLTEKEFYVFEEVHKSTPGISLLQTKLSSNLYQSNLILNLWDFGGQDLYHATHRLFMQTRAVIILVWDTENEFNDCHWWNGKKYKNHKLRYWLSYAELFAPDSPIIILENKVDGEYDEGHLPNPEKGKLKADYPNIAGFMFGSVKTGLNLGAFQELLLKTLEENPVINQEIFNFSLPITWINVRNKIRKIQLLNDGIKELSHEEFNNLCVSEGIDESKNTLLEFFHETGVLYFHKYYFDRKIILDQAWIIKAIYEFFNHSNNYAEYLRIENRSFICYEDICKIWPLNSDQERELFLKFLIDAELCFVQSQTNEIQFKNRKYVVPQILTEERPINIDDYIDEYGLSEKYSQTFKLIPASFIHRFTVRIKPIAEIKDLWQYGIYFAINDRKVVVEISSIGDKLVIHYSPDANDLRDFVLDEFGRIKQNLPFNLFEGERDTVNEMILKGRERSKNRIKKIGYPSNIKIQEMSEKKMINVFVSYAHEDRDYFEVFSREFNKQLNTSLDYQFNSFDDRQIVLGSDWNIRLGNELKSCQVGILLVSSAFLISEYIQEKELSTLIDRLENQEDFVLVPIYFEAFDFNDLNHLKALQFFKPIGANYGFSEKSDFCFAHLVTFHSQNGKPITTPNSHRNDYLRDLKKHLLGAIEKKFR